MPCPFCLKVKISPCPVCEKGAVPIRKDRGAKRAPRPQSPKVASAPKAPTAVPLCITCNKAHVSGTTFVRRDDGLMECRECFNAKAAPSPTAVNILAFAPRGQLARVGASPDPTPTPTVDRSAPTNPGRVAGSPSRIVAAIRKAFADGQVTVGVGLMVGLAGGPERSQRIEILTLIDKLAQQRGFMVDRDKRVRDQICAACVRDLGFDPLIAESKPAKVDANATVICKPEELPDYQRPQVSFGAPPSRDLAQGDWAELDRRVRSGELTNQEAIAIGQLWNGKGGRA